MTARMIRRVAVWTCGLLVAGLAVGEIVARLVFGLGTPPLTIVDPSIEYMFAPNQDVSRFRNRQLYNEYGMRSISLREASFNRLVLVLGDSVLNGGSLTDHRDLATSIATDQSKSNARPTLYGNVSAGSWGPGNMRAWLERYGLLGADTLIFVLSSHDVADAPTFLPLDPLTHPTEPPASALLEGLQRYLPRFVPAWTASHGQEGAGMAEQLAGVRTEAALAATERDIRNILDMAKTQGIRVCLIQHITQAERGGARDPGHEDLGAQFARRGLPRIDDSGLFSLPGEQANAAFRDDIHINALGQKYLAGRILECDQAAAVPT